MQMLLNYVLVFTNWLAMTILIIRCSGAGEICQLITIRWHHGIWKMRKEILSCTLFYILIPTKEIKHTDKKEFDVPSLDPNISSNVSEVCIMHFCTVTLWQLSSNYGLQQLVGFCLFNLHAHVAVNGLWKWKKLRAFLYSGSSRSLCW